MLSTLKTCGAAAGFASLALLATASPGLAASDTAQRIVSGDTPVTYVQWHGRHGGPGHGFRGGFRGPHPGFHGPRFGHRRPYYGHRRWGYGPGLGIGLATGAILGGALAAQAAPPPVPDANYLAYCESKYRSFDPGSGTYLGYDGLRHACVYP